MKLSKQEFVRFKENNPLELFRQGIRTEATRSSYTRKLKHTLCHVFEDILEGSFEERAVQLVKLARDDPDWMLDLLLNLSRKLRQRTELPKDDPDYFNPSSFYNHFKPIKKLLDMNNVTVSWKRVYSTFPELDNIADGRGWSRDEINKMLQFARGALDRAIVLIASSSGIRLGGFEMDWGDVRPIYKVGQRLQFEFPKETEDAELACACLKIYKGSAWEYSAFITPEAYSALMDYKIEWAVETGREPTPQDPMFKKRGTVPRRADKFYVKQRIEKIVEKCRLRIPLPEDQRRHEVPITNGFRRYWNKCCKESHSNDSLGSLIKKEYMMGHVGLVKLDKNYFKTHVLELAKEYLRAIPLLTVSNEFRLLSENKDLKNQLLTKNSRVTKLIDELKNDPLKFESLLSQID